MTVTKVPLSLSEKKTLNSAFNIRMALGLFVILPILFTSAYLFLESAIDYSANHYAGGTLIFCTGFFVLCAYLFFRLAVPFYRQTFKGIRAKDKLIIETVIISIKSEWVDEFGITYVIQTESPAPIVSTINRLLNPAFGYKDLRLNMRIRIHCIEDNFMDILCIEPV